jgi:hypothetical protein
MTSTLVEFTAAELNQIPTEFWPLTQKYPRAFAAYFDFMAEKPEQSGDSFAIYFNDDTEPAISWTGNFLDDAFETQGELEVISIFRGEALVYFEALGRVWHDDRKENFPDLNFFR